MRKIDLTGQRFGRYLVVAKAGLSAGKSMWLCECTCGAQKTVRGTHLTGAKVLSCGCHREDKARSRATHGLSKTRPYRIWRDMINRCHYAKYPERHLYGGRGIEVCQRWRYSFEAFISDMGMPEPHQSIDRKDNDGDYEPGNCRWATAKEQAANRRRPTAVARDVDVRYREYAC